MSQEHGTVVTDPSELMNGKKKDGSNDCETYTYEIPKNLKQFAGGIKTITLVVLTPEDEQAATKRAKSQNQMALANELFKACLYAVNGKRVSMTGEHPDAGEAFKKMHPKIRQLIANAYAKLHVVDDEDINDFLGTVIVKT